MIPTLLVSGGDYTSREEVIVARLKQKEDTQRVVVILEGLPSGQAQLESNNELVVQRIAPGCMCCIGNLTMRVTLNRAIQRQPDLLCISIADVGHLDQIHTFLGTAPYSSLLTITEQVQI